MWGSKFFGALHGFSSGMLFEEVWSLSVLSTALPLLSPSDWCFRPVFSQILHKNTVSVDSFLAASGENLGSGLLTE